MLPDERGAEEMTAHRPGGSLLQSTRCPEGSRRRSPTHTMPTASRIVRFLRCAAVAGLSGLAPFALLAADVATDPTAADNPATPSAVVIAGSLQSELGCAADWDPACAATGLTYDATDQVWQGTFAVPAGSYDYLGALNGSWVESYGLGGVLGGANIPLSVGATTAVKFYYDDVTHWVTDSVNSVIATVPGSFQSEIGCPGDWQPDCLRSWLEDLDGDGRYRLTVRGVPAGNYECKVTISESWTENYGLGGIFNGANIPFTQPWGDYQLDFDYDSVTHILTITAALFADGFEVHGFGYWSVTIP